MSLSIWASLLRVEVKGAAALGRDVRAAGRPAIFRRVTPGAPAKRTPGTSPTVCSS